MDNIKLNIVDAIKSLAPNAEWNLIGNSYNGLEWLDKTIPKPTEQELLVEVKRLQAEHDKYKYTRDRAKAYPSIQDQLDTLYHGGYDEWKATIAAVKEQFPKSE